MPRTRPSPLLHATIALVALVIAACAGGSAAIPTPTPQPTPLPTATPTPTPAPTPTPTPTPAPQPFARFVAERTKQGGFIVVRYANPAPGTQEVSAQFNGESYSLVADGVGWTGVIGLPTVLPVGEYTVDVLADGALIDSLAVTVADGGYPYIDLAVSDDTFNLLTDQAKIAAEHERVRDVYTTFTPERLWSGEWLKPAQGPLSNPFGVQRSVNGGPYSEHGGTDVVGSAGDPIVAAQTGRVVLAEPLYLLGNSVIIDHGAGLLTGYHHLSAIAVTAGQAITKGDLVGAMGTTGFSTGDHLHWEARIHGVKIDPLLLLEGPLDP
ncbi:MAG: M23 family metallopeptidase [Dehalococcoidia bacterium]